MEIRLRGQTYALRFTWDSLAAIEEAHGENPNLFSVDIVSSVAAIGFKEKHPELTAERIKAISPPLLPFAQSVQKALQWAYFGPEGIPEESEEEKKRASPIKGGFWRRIARLWRKG